MIHLKPNRLSLQMIYVQMDFALQHFQNLKKFIFQYLIILPKILKFRNFFTQPISFQQTPYFISIKKIDFAFIQYKEIPWLVYNLHIPKVIFFLYLHIFIKQLKVIFIEIKEHYPQKDFQYFSKIYFNQFSKFWQIYKSYNLLNHLKQISCNINY